ncbi:hypothetical protein [Halococcus saccharolyticus]|uniref:Uncharacterized protein n=1 Tax=Halococcus saccharolyticus DSM 5350 TaxID=1227455 RepID=M0MCS8_9EURY|nr:hypothetical protein [Halococcus saccharolyticus]EMA43562.1 hypothetical protein C449_13422 [Halococcus saccharolyticus DSM 5350]
METNSNLVTTSGAVQAWRDDRENMTDAELSGLTREGVILRDLNAGVFLRVIDAPAESGPESERSVTFEDDNGKHATYQLDHLRSYLTRGTVEPVPREVIENAEQIVHDVARHELTQLDTLSRDSAYNVTEHTETYADARNALLLDGIDGIEEDADA